MKEIGLVGAPYSGKSTLFTALTGAAGAHGKVSRGEAPVPDDRLEVLAAMESSKRIVHARLQLDDVPGGFSRQGLATLRESDALCVVLRGFGPDPSPAGELSEVTDELLLADLALVEGALDPARRSSKGRRRGEEPPELASLERARAALEGGRPLRDEGLEERDLVALRGLGPLSLKPWVVVVNLEEGGNLPQGLPGDPIGVWSEVEAEAAALPPEEAAELRSAFGVVVPGLQAVVTACYRALDLVTFLTFNREEARAWEIPIGTTAEEAAGVIHSDLRRGFVRAEVISFDDVVAAGGWERARAAGLFRVEGKDYVVREGDVLHVRFAV